MAPAKIIEIMIMEGIALLLFAFAYLIGVKGRLISRLCLLLAVASALMPALTALVAARPHGLAYAIGGYGGFTLGLVGLVSLQARDYTA